MPSIALVHLVRKNNDPRLLGRFLASYRRYPAGIEHELVILFKGFSDIHDIPKRYGELLSDIPCRKVFVPDHGYDINAYFAVVEKLDHSHFCFLNSHSRIKVEDWLAKMSHWIMQNGVGLVGATGSSLSIASGHIERRSLPFVRRMLASAADVIKTPGQSLMYWGLGKTPVWQPATDFPLAPNYHLRTNAFMGSREILQGIQTWPMRIKFSAYKFESGNNSMTRQVLKQGARVLVIGSDGYSYQPEDWHSSNTFWQSRQENLLIADNQTIRYDNESPLQRAKLSRFAWGALARPD